MAEQEAYRELAVAGGRSRYYVPPQGAEDLLARSRLIEEATRLGGTLVVLIKEIGTDALFGLSIVCAEIDRRLGTDYLARVRAFHERCAEGDLALAVAQTDVKGDRSLGPAEQGAQGHPDAYLRIVERRPDGSWCGAARPTPPSLPTPMRSSSSPRGPWARPTPTTPWPSPSLRTPPA